VKKDLIISAYKPNGGLENRFKIEAGTEEGAWDFVRTHLKQLPVFVTKDGQAEIVAERQNYLLFDRMAAFHRHSKEKEKELTMRRFSSYGPIDTDDHYYAPRKELIEQSYNQLLGENPQKGGHYITVWAPRQCVKTWVMQEVVEKTRNADQFEIGIISMQRAKKEKNEKKVLEILMEKLQITFGKSFTPLEKINDLPRLFSKQYFQKPVILILDEFDALLEEFINDFASIFRDIYLSRTNEKNKTSQEKTYLLHGLALVGVRSVLGIEYETGSPFNVQRSLHIPNLTF
jgi:hypothetical protein